MHILVDQLQWCGTACGPPGCANRCRFEVRYHPFETGPLHDDERFDLVVTSPPFFDLEIYVSDSKDDKQSSTSFPELATWLTGFLFVSMAKAWAHLDAGGHMVRRFTKACLCVNACAYLSVCFVCFCL